MKKLASSLRLRLLLGHLLSVASVLAAVLLLADWIAPSLMQAIRTSPGAIMLLALAALATALIVGLLLSSQMTLALDRAVQAVRRIAAGQYAERLRPDELAPVDEQGHLAAALDNLSATLEAAEQRRIDLLGDVAHELRTPVAILSGYMEGLLDGYVKPEARTWAMLHDEATRLHRLVDELQALARAESRQLPSELVPLDPAELASSALDRLRLHFAEKGLEVITAIPAGLPQVRANRDYSLQILGNLMTNSLRYTPTPGKVTLSVSRPPDSNEVLFQVSDTGIGLAPEHIPHLFERFFRVDRSRNRAGGGSGIGLPLAKALVEAMGGRIWAESPGLGQGSTFSFTLPVAQKR